MWERAVRGSICKRLPVLAWGALRRVRLEHTQVTPVLSGIFLCLGQRLSVHTLLGRPRAVHSEVLTYRCLLVAGGQF